MYRREYLKTGTDSSLTLTRLKTPLRVHLNFLQGVAAGVNPRDAGVLDALVNASNVVYQGMVIERSRGLTTIPDVSFSGIPLCVHTTTDLSGNNKFVVVTTTNVYVNSAGVWSSIGSYEGDVNNPVFMATWYDTSLGVTTIISSGSDYVKKITDSDYDNLGGLTYTKANCCTVFRNRILLGGTEENGTYNPWRIRWSVLADGEDWDGTGSGHIDLIDTPGDVVAFFVHMDRCFVFKTDSIWELVYVGYPDIFVVGVITSFVGLRSPKSLIPVSDMSGTTNIAAFIGTSDVCMFDGRTVTTIGNEYIRNLLFGATALTPEESYKKAFGLRFSSDRQIKMFVPTTREYADKAYVYDFYSKSWWIEDYAPEYTCTGSVVDTTATGLAWENVSGTWSDGTFGWVSKGTVPTGEVTWLLGPDQYDQVSLESYSRSGSLPGAFVESGDLGLGGLNNRWLEVSAEVEGGTMEALYSTDSGVTWTSLGTRTGSSSGLSMCSWPMNVTSQNLRFRFVFGTATKLRRVVVYVVMRVV